MKLTPRQSLVAALLISVVGISLHAQTDRQLVQNGSPASAASKRMALVLGNGAYTNAPPLKNPPNDAREMAASLRTLGFDVASGINVNQKEMKRLIREFGLKLKAGGSGLFYYAGHGVQSKGRNFLIPVDADIQSETEVEDLGVDVNLVLGYMDDAQNGLNIVILDACRNNPFARSFRAASNGLAQVDAPTGTLIAYATAPGRVASDGSGQNGLYTAELLKQMRVPAVSITDMFMRVRAEVMKQTENKQVPWEASSLVGAFYFSGAPNEVASTTAASKIDPVAFELSYWETIKNSQSADDFKAYLARYPQGQFVDLAKNRIATLQPATKPAETSVPATSGGQAEITFWDSIKNSTSADDYRAYLEKYPHGEFAGLAKRRLAPLETIEKEKAKADEAARNTKTFVGRFGRWAATLSYNHPGKLIITPTLIQFVYDEVEENKSAITEKTFEPDVIKCSDLDVARTEGEFVREIKNAGDKYRFMAKTGAEASDALSAMRYVCANPGKNFTDSDATNGNSASDQLTGTKWSGDSTGGDKHYEFQFLPNSEVIWSLKWGRLDNPTYRGTYTRTGNDIQMTFPEGKLVGAGTVSAGISGNQLSGSWNFGSSDVKPDNGMYKFTVTRQGSETSAAPTTRTNVLEGSTWKGDSPGGDKHYQVQFLPQGQVIWNLKWNNYGEVKGFWRQEGNTITLVLDGYLKPVLITLNGDTMNGSWSGGQYKFTLTKVQ